MQHHADTGTQIRTPSRPSGTAVLRTAMPGIQLTLAVALGLLTLMSITACGDGPWNRPYPARDAGSNVLYSSFSARPNHLDPARSYSSNEITFTGQIYEPPLQYHYLKRPYTLIPLTAARLPERAFSPATWCSRPSRRRSPPPTPPGTSIT